MHISVYILAKVMHVCVYVYISATTGNVVKRLHWNDIK